MRVSDVRIVLVCPEYNVNLGFVARAMKNMGFSNLFLVRPKADKKSLDARKYAKHAQDLLKKSVTVSSLDEAIQGCSLVVGTTGIQKRGNQCLRSPVPLREFAERASKRRGKLAILIGREGTGLAQSEIKKCDFVATIPANPEYPVMNISHALAVILYELRYSLEGAPEPIEKAASPAKKKEVYKSFSSMVSAYSSGLRNPAKIRLSLKRLVGRALITDLEASALLGVLKKAEADVQEANKRSRKRKSG